MTEDDRKNAGESTDKIKKRKMPLTERSAVMLLVKFRGAKRKCRPLR